MEMFKRLKRLIELSKKDPKALKVLEGLTDEQIKVIPDEPDGKAEFLGVGTEEDFIEQQRKDEGMDKWYNRLKNL